MNILVTGANGQLGSEMRIVAPRSGNNWFFTDVNDMPEEQAALIRKLSSDSADVSTGRLDITDLQSIRRAVADNSIDVIVNCAAYTNVDAAEDNFALAETLNAVAPRNLALAMAETGGLLVHISTDYVFGKEPYNVPCHEDQKGTPTGVYGQTKLHGENFITASGCRHFIIRTAWLYSEFGKNFCKTMMNLTATKPRLNVVFDQAGTPTYAYDLACAIVGILDSGSTEYGIYHFSNEGVCSWYDFTKMIQKYSGNDACQVLPCHSSEFPSKVVRPSYSVLDKTKIKTALGLEIPYWTDSLEKCISHLNR